MNEYQKVVGRPFPRGTSGNPGGRPKELRDVTELARTHSAKAIKTLAEIMDSDSAPPAARVGAATAILDRGWGKPKQSIEGQVGLTLERMVLMAIERDEQQTLPKGHEDE